MLKMIFYKCMWQFHFAATIAGNGQNMTNITTDKTNVLENFTLILFLFGSIWLVTDNVREGVLSATSESMCMKY